MEKRGGDKKSIISSFFFPVQIPQWTVPAGRSITVPSIIGSFPETWCAAGTCFYHFCPGRQAQINPACAALPIPAAAGEGQRSGDATTEHCKERPALAGLNTSAR